MPDLPLWLFSATQSLRIYSNDTSRKYILSNFQSKGGRQTEHSDMQILIIDSSKGTQHELWNCLAAIELFLQ